MFLFRLWCAGILCEHQLKRFHWTCFFCRTRRRHLGKWTDPPFYWHYQLPWDKSRELLIDPRGRFVWQRCIIIIVLERIVAKFNRFHKPLHSFCEMLAAITL